MRFLIASILSAALALPSFAQPGPRGGGGFSGRGGGGPEGSNAEVEKLKEQIKELEAKMKKMADSDKKKDDVKKPEPKKDEAKKPEPKKDEAKKPEPKKDEAKKPEDPESRRGPMGGFGTGGGFGGPGMGSFGTAQGGMRGVGPSSMNLATMPGLNNLTEEEQAMLKKLVEKMRAPKPEPKATGSTTGNSIEARLDRLEKMVQELARNRGAEQPPRGGERGEQRRPEGDRRPDGDRRPEGRDPRR